MSIEQHSPAWMERLQDSLEGALAPHEAAALQEHVQGCETCRRHLALLRQLDESLREAVPRAALDERFDAQVLARAVELDERARAAARRRIEDELQAGLAAWSRSWRRSLALFLPGTIVCIAGLMAVGTLPQAQDVLRALRAQAAGWLDPGIALIAGPALLGVLGGLLGLGLARWLTSVAD